MVNKNYVAGRNLEYRIKKSLESKGYFVIRSSGSHTPIDLVAIKNSVTYLIQAKNNCRVSKKELKELFELESKLLSINKPFIILPICIVENINKKLKLRVILHKNIGEYDYNSWWI
jgi:Holliday junction resolvase